MTYRGNKKIELIQKYISEFVFFIWKKLLSFVELNISKIIFIELLYLLNFLFFLKATTANGDTAIHLATRRRDVEMLRILVDYGAGVDVQNGEGQTALHLAAAEGDELLVKYFYGVRASASIVDHQGNNGIN